MGTQPSPHKGLLWPNGWTHQDATWYGCRPQPRGLCVRWRPSPSSPKRGRSPTPKFSAHAYCGQTAGWIKMPLGTKVGLSPGDSCVRWSSSHPPHKGGEAPPQFSAHFYCETARCIKMPLGMDVGLSPGDFVLDGDPVLPSQ